MSLYQKIRPVLFKLDPERAHSLVKAVLHKLPDIPFADDLLLKISGGYKSQMLKTKVCGLDFYNPVGLAAGFDKDGEMVKALGALGFGFLELGTITKIPQAGNPKPRLFRHIDEESLQNEMGFNNCGSQEFAKNIQKYHPFSIPIGVNIGKNKDVEIKDSLYNYEDALKDVLKVGDYYVFNLSSPNTPKLRDLQNEKFVEELFEMAQKHTKKPVFLKISPDLDIDKMLKVCDSALSSGASGIISTNTTTDSTLLASPKNGGISGKVLKEKSLEVLRELADAFFGKGVIMSVGGISSARDVYERMRIGASLVQVYTAFIYEGPTLCSTINKELEIFLKADGFSNIGEAIGAELGKKGKKRLEKLQHDDDKKKKDKKASKDDKGDKKSHKHKIDIDSLFADEADDKNGAKKSTATTAKSRAKPATRRTTSSTNKSTSTKTNSTRTRRPSTKS